ncbi:hypothetical protein FIBSPDRAFT_510327 [Athelia psychrophila]|uniref:Uncharacterized protein n=1 Tax=Athelia psychrophila TaxID=1759441 RepID=A0A167TLQ1_9AGAM|nr:hypothetical protein FIBSPDRAFT_510327 [Fibularhizoctonia sp. CBS 109695]
MNWCAYFHVGDGNESTVHPAILTVGICQSCQPAPTLATSVLAHHLDFYLYISPPADSAIYLILYTPSRPPSLDFDHWRLSQCPHTLFDRNPQPLLLVDPAATPSSLTGRLSTLDPPTDYFI